jgi:hypothetical protein
LSCIRLSCIRRPAFACPAFACPAFAVLHSPSCIRRPAFALNKPANPSFAQIGGIPWDADFWTLHNFVADLVLGCKEGHRGGTDPMSDENLFRVFNLRSGPISAAISITIDAPEGG